jgi:hypothetical protein
MNSQLKHLLKEYAELERGVQTLISENCRPICELCTSCCCRADICEEALESPFLRLVHGQNDLESDRYGFLTERGCALEVGRPPVCYEFFCEGVLDAQLSELHSQTLRILGALPTYAGQNALGGAHLVEIMQEEELDHLAFQRLEKQFHTAFEALTCIRRILSGEAAPDTIQRFKHLLPE